MLFPRCVVKDCDYKDTKYAHYFEVHSPMGSMRLRAEDASAKTAWIDSLKTQAQVTRVVFTSFLCCKNDPTLIPSGLPSKHACTCETLFNTGNNISH